MSKSDPDTIVDPLEIIPQYGTDALRLALVSGVTAGNDQRLGKSKVIDNRNFCNKLWNIARYVEGIEGQGSDTKPEPKTPADHWILNKLSILTGVIDKDIDNFRFNDAYQKLYHFVWDDFADWYIEASKAEPNPALLKLVLESTLIVAHPFIPFITEVIWQNLNHKDLLATQLLPQVPAADQSDSNKFEQLKLVVSQARHLIAMTGVKKPRLYFQNAPILAEQANLIARLGRLGGVDEGESGLKLVGTGFDVTLDIPKEHIQSYLEKLAKEEIGIENQIKIREARLNNTAYMEKAPENLRNQTQEELNQLKKHLEEIRTETTSIGNNLGINI